MGLCPLRWIPGGTESPPSIKAFHWQKISPRLLDTKALVLADILKYLKMISEKVDYQSSDVVGLRRGPADGRIVIYWSAVRNWHSHITNGREKVLLLTLKCKPRLEIRPKTEQSTHHFNNQHLEMEEARKNKTKGLAQRSQPSARFLSGMAKETQDNAITCWDCFD